MTGGDVQYGESWDSQRRALVEPVAVAEAGRRHAAGEPYVVLLGGPERPRVLFEVELRKEELTAWCFDEQQRRAFLFEFRLLDLEQMALLRVAEWQYADTDRPEFDATSPRCLTTFGTDGPVAKPIDAPESAFRALRRSDRWKYVPRFEAWAPLVAFLLDAPPERERHRIVPPAAHEPPTAPMGEPPAERRSGPLQPGPELVTAFGPSARYSLAGLLRVTTGQLVVADPGWLDEDLEPFTAATAPTPSGSGAPPTARSPASSPTAGC